MIHRDDLAGYKGTLEELAEEVGDLKYDALAGFLKALSLKIAKDGEKDRSRGRVQLATCLENSAQGLESVAVEIDKAWKICEPFMKK